jgi:hypothetical protein
MRFSGDLLIGRLIVVIRVQWIPAGAAGAAQSGGLREPLLQPTPPAHQQGRHHPHR